MGRHLRCPARVRSRRGVPWGKRGVGGAPESRALGGLSLGASVECARPAGRSAPPPLRVHEQRWRWDARAKNSSLGLGRCIPSGRAKIVRTGEECHGPADAPGLETRFGQPSLIVIATNTEHHPLDLHPSQPPSSFSAWPAPHRLACLFGSHDRLVAGARITVVAGCPR